MSQKCANPKCENEVKSLPGKRPRKYCSTKCTSAHWQALHYEPKKKAKNLVELPADFINCEKIGIIRADGTIEELKDFEQLPETFRIAAKAMWELDMDEINFKPQEAHKTKKQDNLPPKEESVKGEAENELHEAITDILNGDVQETIKRDRIAQIEENLKLPLKYLPKFKRTELERELNQLKSKLQ